MSLPNNLRADDPSAPGRPSGRPFRSRRLLAAGTALLFALLLAGDAEARRRRPRGRHEPPTAASPIAVMPPLPSPLAEAVRRIADARRGERWAVVLQELAALERREPLFFEENGYRFLEARALGALGRTEEAKSCWARVAAAGGPLASRARLRLAWLAFESAAPDGVDRLLEVAESRGDDSARATERIADFLETHDPARLLAVATRLERTGPATTRRSMRLDRAVALRLLGRQEEAARLFLELATSEPARVESYAALRELEKLGRGMTAPHPPATLARLAETALRHRDFDHALPALERILPPGASREFRLGRALESAGRLSEAARRYEAAAELDPGKREVCFFRLSQLHGLAGNSDAAVEAATRLLLAARSESSRQRARLVLLRLEVEGGHLDRALEHFSALGAAASLGGGGATPPRGKGRRRAPPPAPKGFFFDDARVLLGSALLEAGRTADGARLLDGGPKGTSDSLLLDYWRGRAEEATGRRLEAAGRWAALSARAGDDPLGAAARQRIEKLDPAVRSVARQEALARSLSAPGPEPALAAGRLLLALSVTPPERQEALDTLRRTAAASPRLAPFLRLEPAPLPEPLPPGHPAAGRDATRMFAALGLFDEAGAGLARLLPLRSSESGLAAALAWSEAGDWNRAIYAAEILRDRAAGLPFDLLPRSLARLLYPLAYPSEVASSAMASRVEPELIRAVIREESRFRPSAGSGAAARGLMQFVISTAREVSIHLGFGEIRPDDLYRTDLSVRLGGRYLADLLAKFDSEKGPAIAAYNAGPSAAGAWRRFARNGEVERYLAAINYPETRAYVRKVYGSYLRYRQLAEEESGRASTERPATGPGGRHTSASD